MSTTSEITTLPVELKSTPEDVKLSEVSPEKKTEAGPSDKASVNSGEVQNGLCKVLR